MPPKPRVFVLDSWAVLAYLGDEQTGQEVADMIASAQDSGHGPDDEHRQRGRGVVHLGA